MTAEFWRGGRRLTNVRDATEAAGAELVDIELANQVRLLRHRLQALLQRMAMAGVDVGGPVATHSEIAWVHDQVMTRPFIAQVVSRWFTQVRRATRAQVRLLREVSEIVDAIEELMRGHSLCDRRMADAVAMHVIDQSERK